MDRGVILAVRRRYKKKLRGLLIADDTGASLIAYLKSINMETVVQLIRSRSMG